MNKNCIPSGFIFEYKVLSFLELNEVMIILYDYKDFPKNEQAKNLRCYKSNMDLLWIAEHPTNTTADCYTTISIFENTKLVANNFLGYNCLIDPLSGKIETICFTK